jgi:hypothetical protein
VAWAGCQRSFDFIFFVFLSFFGQAHKESFDEAVVRAAVRVCFFLLIFFSFFFLL